MRKLLVRSLVLVLFCLNGESYAWSRVSLRGRTSPSIKTAPSGSPIAELKTMMDMAVVGSVNEGPSLTGVVVPDTDSGARIIHPKEMESSALVAVQHPSFSALHVALEGMIANEIRTRVLSADSPGMDLRGDSLPQNRKGQGPSLPGTMPEGFDGSKLVSAVIEQMGEVGVGDLGQLSENEMAFLSQRILKLFHNQGSDDRGDLSVYGALDTDAMASDRRVWLPASFAGARERPERREPSAIPKVPKSETDLQAEVSRIDQEVRSAIFEGLSGEPGRDQEAVGIIEESLGQLAKSADSFAGAVVNLLKQAHFNFSPEWIVEYMLTSMPFLTVNIRHPDMDRLRGAFKTVLGFVRRAGNDKIVRNLALLAAYTDHLKDLKKPSSAPQPALPSLPKEVKSRTVLDLASGPKLAEFLNTLPKDIHLVGVDHSLFVYTYVNARARLLGLEENVSILQTDLMELGMPREPYGLIRVKNVWTYAPEFQKKLKELPEWLIDGGRLVFQVDAEIEHRHDTFSHLDSFARNLIDRGWQFHYEKGADSDPYPLDTLTFVKPSSSKRPSQRVSSARRSWLEYFEFIISPVRHNLSEEHKVMKRHRSLSLYAGGRGD